MAFSVESVPLEKRTLTGYSATADCWVIELESLEHLLRLMQEIDELFVLNHASEYWEAGTQLPSIEIYDDYRE